MLQKNIDKQARKSRDTWVGYYPRRTPTKKTKMERQERKHKNKQPLSRIQWQGSYFTSILENFIGATCRN